MLMCGSSGFLWPLWVSGPLFQNLGIKCFSCDYSFGTAEPYLCVCVCVTELICVTNSFYPQSSHLMMILPASFVCTASRNVASDLIPSSSATDIAVCYGRALAVCKIHHMSVM